MPKRTMIPGDLIPWAHPMAGAVAAIQSGADLCRAMRERRAPEESGKPGAVVLALGGDSRARRIWCELGEFRPPMAGEYYASGAIPEAWRAPNDLSQAFRIVRPVCYARRVNGWSKGEPFP